MALKLRLALAFSAFAAALAFFGSFLLLHQVSSRLLESANVGLKASTAIIANNISNLQDTNGQSGSDVLGSQVGANLQDPPNLQIAGLPFNLTAPRSPIDLAEVISSKGAVLIRYGASNALIDRTGIRQALASETSYVKDLAKPLGKTLVVAQAIPGSSTDVLVVAMSLHSVGSEVSRTVTILLIVGLVLTLLAFGAGYLLAGAALAPVERMRAQAAAMVASRRWGILNVGSSPREIAELTTTLNDLIAQITDSNSRQREFVAAAGHQLRTPLAILGIELELASNPSRSLVEMRDAVTSARQETERLIRIAQGLLTLAKGDESRLMVVPEVIIVRDAVALVARTFEKVAQSGGVTFVLLGDPNLRCICDPDGFHQVIANLLENAIRFSPIQKSVEIEFGESHNRVCILVTDHGMGFAPDVLAAPFERFGRAQTKENLGTSGSGLGLSIVKTFVEANAGKVELGNAIDGGAWVRVLLPMDPATSGVTTPEPEDHP